MYKLLIGPLREKARALGYALAVHGTLMRDIDLIACPWTDDAVEAKTLAEELRKVAEKVNPVGVAFCKDRMHADNPQFFDDGCPGMKPHGRLAWSFHLGGGPYIDLSVMPRNPSGPHKP
ncbi:MAG: hypothetical protein K8U57_30490 [Planctomycetes bacterium]|nr:hypothetical protein [Planctomycetota bacterium]